MGRRRGAPLSPTNLFAPVSTPAQSIHELALFILAVAAAIFLVVFGLLLYAVVRFRGRPTDDPREPPQVYGSQQIELAWTVIPVLIVVVLFLATSRVISPSSTRRVRPGRCGHGDRPPVLVGVPLSGAERRHRQRAARSGQRSGSIRRRRSSQLFSADTDHSFWVPRLAGKTDLIPNRVNRCGSTRTRPGLYLGQCAQYCGTQHAKMLLRVYVHTPRGLRPLGRRHSAAGAGQRPAVPRGRRVFEHDRLHQLPHRRRHRRRRTASVPT